ncbi:MAG: SGNH/GDSL hydrolase family protein [Candidatus Latescibacteria bacterium]|nr:SGNH/GDSL hydrolase family protein [Candidatus Latescibacterota bacterium]
MAFWIEDNETMLFIGDSITDCGRRTAEAPLGGGYVRSFTEMTTANFPARNIKYINKGIGGNRVTNLHERWQDDVIHNKPDKLSIKIGINDLHSVLRKADDAVPPARFEELYDSILDTTQKELGCPVVLITPFYISTDTSGQTFRSQVMALIPEYIGIVEKMSEKYDTKLVRLHDLFQEHLKYRDSETFCPEPVHPNRTGHLVIADALFKELS